MQVVTEVLLPRGLPAGQLTLEVTEGVLVRDVDEVVEQLRAIRSLGVRIAIDDFGTGYSSPSYLRRLPADIVKIDPASFGSSAMAGPTTLVASIIELARSLQLDVVRRAWRPAEQHALLGSLSCSHAQGHLFGRPDRVRAGPGPRRSPRSARQQPQTERRGPARPCGRQEPPLLRGSE